MRERQTPGQHRELAEEVRWLVGRYRGRLGAADAEDLAQQAALRAIERAAPDGRTGPWIQRIAANLLIDRWRRRARAERALRALAAAPGPTPEDALALVERRTAVRRALAGLPRDLRRPVLLRFWKAEPYETASVRLGVIAPTARTRVRRGLARLRLRLAALRAWLPPWPVALKPALVALFVVASESVIPPRVVLAEEPAAADPAPRKAAPPPVLRIPPARTEPAPPPKPQARRAVDVEPPPAQYLTFGEGDEVEGFVVGPDGEPVVGMPSIPFSSLIEIRTSFRPEIVKTLEDL